MPNRDILKKKTLIYLESKRSARIKESKGGLECNENGQELHNTPFFFKKAKQILYEFNWLISHQR